MARLTRVESAKANRRRKSVESFKSAQDCIGPLEHGMSIFAVTRGQFSMIDVINDLVWKLGQAELSVWTWAIAEYEVEVFTALLERAEIRAATLIIDYTGENRNPRLLQDWRDRFGPGSVRVCRTHAKIARIWNDDFRFLARGSMNLNYNPRFEQFDLTEGGEDFDLVADIESELKVLDPHPTRRQAEQNSQLELAWVGTSTETWGEHETWKRWEHTENG